MLCKTSLHIFFGDRGVVLIDIIICGIYIFSFLCYWSWISIWSSDTDNILSYDYIHYYWKSTVFTAWGQPFWIHNPKWLSPGSKNCTHLFCVKICFSTSRWLVRKYINKTMVANMILSWTLSIIVVTSVHVGVKQSLWQWWQPFHISLYTIYIYICQSKLSHDLHKMLMISFIIFNLN